MENYSEETKVNNTILYASEQLEDAIVIKELEELYMASFKESETVEFKKSVSELDSALKTICAFLNNRGGAVYFGIDNSGNITGQLLNDSNLREISQKIRNILYLSGLIDNWGRGTLNIIKEMKKEELKPPKFQESCNFFTQFSSAHKTWKKGWQREILRLRKI